MTIIIVLALENNTCCSSRLSIIIHYAVVTRNVTGVCPTNDNSLFLSPRFDYKIIVDMANDDNGRRFPRSYDGYGFGNFYDGIV